MPKKKTQDDIVVLRHKFAEISDVVSTVERWIDEIWATVFTWYSTYEPGSAARFLQAFKLALKKALEVRRTSSLVDEDVQTCKRELGKSYEADVRSQGERIGQALKTIEQVKEDDAQLAEAVLGLGVATIGVMELGIAPARKARTNLIAGLRLAQPKTRSRGRRGRPPDPEVAKRNKRMREAWSTGCYRTYEELGTAFRTGKDTARRVAKGVRKGRNS